MSRVPPQLQERSGRGRSAPEGLAGVSAPAVVNGGAVPRPEAGAAHTPASGNRPVPQAHRRSRRGAAAGLLRGGRGRGGRGEPHPAPSQRPPRHRASGGRPTPPTPKRRGANRPDAGRGGHAAASDQGGKGGWAPLKFIPSAAGRRMPS